MKALIRNDGETVTENMGIEGIDWNTGAPMTNAAWCGGPYILVQNYVEGEDGIVTNVPTSEDTVVIDGVTYTRVS